MTLYKRICRLMEEWGGGFLGETELHRRARKVIGEVRKSRVVIRVNRGQASVSSNPDRLQLVIDDVDEAP